MSTKFWLESLKERRRPFGRPRRRWEDIIKMDLGEMDLDGMNWTHLTQNRAWWRSLVNPVMNFRAP
jgi:hypothetical protein